MFAGWPWFRGDGRYPLPAYSESMPPPRLGRKPYGEADDPADPYGWPVAECEEVLELRPGLHRVGRHLLAASAGVSPPPLAAMVEGGNPYWPADLAARAGRLGHNRLVLLLPLALARTQIEEMGV